MQRVGPQGRTKLENDPTLSLPAPLRLRPLEIGDVLDETFRMYRRHFVLFAGISVLLAIPSAALVGYSYLTLFGSLLTQLSSSTSGTVNAADLNAVAGSLAALAIGGLIYLFLIPFFYGAVTFAACESALGRPVTAASVFRGVTKKYFGLLGYWLLIGVMTVAFCLIPLWLWFWVGWIAVMPIMFVEDAGLGDAMRRSWRMVQGRWWRTFLLLLLVFLVSYVVRIGLAAFLGLGEALLSIVLSSAVGLAIAGAAGQIVDSLVNPILQIGVVMIYFDLRVRREALDLFQLAQRLPPPPA